MRRAPDPNVETCDHGYEIEAASRECARCADRPVPLPRAEPRFPQTRWHATDTTLGPRVKVTITLALVVPLLVMVYALHLAFQRPILTVLIVPFAVPVRRSPWIAQVSNPILSPTGPVGT